MKRLIAMVLIGLLVAPPASAGQKQGKPIDWQKAQTLKPGTEVVLTVTGGQPTKVRFLFADDTMIVTLKPTAPKLPGGVKKFLFSVGPHWPGILNTDATFSDERLRVSQDGIFDRDTKLAGLADVVQHTPRVDVREILGPPSHRLRNILIITATAAGLLLLIGIVTSGSESGLLY
jgi:hypothetical protein